MTTPTPEANLDHPLVEIACRMLQPDAEERWRLDDEGASIIERALLHEKDDPKLPAAMLGLFHLATDLERAQGAHTAAGRLFAVLGAVGPRLFANDSAPGDLQDLITQAQKYTGSSERKLPLPIDGPAPEGTIPAHRLRARPSGRKRRR